MKRNVAGQSIGAQMVNATTGVAFTGAVAVSVTIDNGVQTAGAGVAPAHEGNGYHSYTPTQAETNGDHLAFTFTGTGAIPVTVQVYTGFPQAGDSFARLGAPVGASVSADVAAVQADTDNLQTRIPAALVAGRMASNAEVVGDKTGYALTAAEHTALVNAVWDELTSELRTAGSYGQKVKDLVVDGSGRVTVGAMGPNTLDAAALATDAVNEIVAGILAGIIEGTITLKQSLQLANAASAGKLSGAATATVAIRNLADTIDRIAATVDADGNRSAVTRTFE